MFAFAKQLVRSAEGIIANNPNSSEAYHLPLDHNRRRPDPTHGFRVVNVVAGSPAYQAGIQSLFDFIIGINGHSIVGEQQPQSSYNPQQQPPLTPQYQQQQQQQQQQQFSPPQSQSPHSQQYQPQHRHNRTSSLSFASASGIITQLVPPQPEISPIEPFVAEVQACKGRSVSLEVWSSKGRTRRVLVVPVPQDGSLGLSLQWTPLSVADHVWHVLNVAPNSPAQKAGLISHSDYIVGAENGMLETGGEDLLGRVVQKLVSHHNDLSRAQHEQQLQQDKQEETVHSQAELELFVYNADYDTLRAVRIRPTTNWGGSGLLGCGVGYGLLHRLPAIHKDEYQDEPAGQYHPQGGYNPSAIPEEEEEEALSDPSQSFTPANIVLPPPPTNVTSGAGAPAGNVGGARKKKHHYPNVGSQLEPHVAAAPNNKINNDLAAYFAEEEQRSKELDGYTTPTPGANGEKSSLPPPPPPTA
ncbi:hypothetical protein DV453_000816 [Geotrichum candidum]|nr:hypothetical protein DV453_000816 [Geotrichum candidum]